MEIKQTKIKDIKTYKKNAKKHSKKQIEQVANSIKRFGFAQPLVIDKNNEIIIGHCRLEASKKLGLTEVPTLKMESLSDEEVKALRLADNKLNESPWDMDLVIEELKGLSDDLLDLSGFDKDLIIEPDEKDDEVPEVPEEPKSKLGDLYELGNHRVLCGDSTKVEDVERLMGGKKADMVFTDPPYGMNLEVKQWNKEAKNGKYFGHNKNYTNVIGDSSDFNPLFITNIFDLFGYVREMFLWGGDYYAELLVNRNKGSWISWDKRDKLENVKWKTSEFELCWSKVKHQRLVARFRWLGLHGTETQDTRRRVHPTQKPIELCQWFLNNWGNENEIVVDLFLGSGSTLIACEKTNRVCYGMELDPKYIDVIVQRYVDYTGDEKIKLNGKEIIWKSSEK